MTAKPRTVFIVALGIAAALLGVSMLSPPAAAGVVPIALYGSRAGGWGFTNTSLTAAGPDLTVHVGDNVSLSLISVDGITHRWFIDYNNNSAAGGTEPTSPNFASTTTPVVYNFTVANVTGTYFYRSDRGAGPGDDLTNMWGNITILAAGTTPPPGIGGENTVLIVAGVIVIIIAVIAFAAFFWRRMGKPGTPPPPQD